MVKLREALAANGFEDAIDEIDDVEEVDEEEEEEESEEEELEGKLEETVVVGKDETGGEDERANEADIVRQDKLAEAAEPKEAPKAGAEDKEGDELAAMLSKVEI